MRIEAQGSQELGGACWVGEQIGHFSKRPSRCMEILIPLGKRLVGHRSTEEERAGQTQVAEVSAKHCRSVA